MYIMKDAGKNPPKIIHCHWLLSGEISGANNIMYRKCCLYKEQDTDNRTIVDRRKRYSTLTVL
jgi:hypothetical protein